MFGLEKWERKESKARESKITKFGLNYAITPYTLHN